MLYWYYQCDWNFRYSQANDVLTNHTFANYQGLPHSYFILRFVCRTTSKFHASEIQNTASNCQHVECKSGLEKCGWTLKLLYCVWWRKSYEMQFVSKFLLDKTHKSSFPNFEIALKYLVLMKQQQRLWTFMFQKGPQCSSSILKILVMIDHLWVWYMKLYAK